MRWVLFLGRVTFIFNVFFIISLLMRHTHFTVPEGLREFVIIQGWILSVVANMFFGAAVIILRSRKIIFTMPNWLLIFNFFCLFFQIFYYIFYPQ